MLTKCAACLPVSDEKKKQPWLCDPPILHTMTAVASTVRILLKARLQFIWPDPKLQASAYMLGS